MSSLPELRTSRPPPCGRRVLGATTATRQPGPGTVSQVRERRIGATRRGHERVRRWPPPLFPGPGYAAWTATRSEEGRGSRILKRWIRGRSTSDRPQMIANGHRLPGNPWWGCRRRRLAEPADFRAVRTHLSDPHPVAAGGLGDKPGRWWSNFNPPLRACTARGTELPGLLAAELPLLEQIAYQPFPGHRPALFT
jgi:hypothetical protein